MWYVNEIGNGTTKDSLVVNLLYDVCMEKASFLSPENIIFKIHTTVLTIFIFFISVVIILFYQITTVSVFIDPFTVHWLTVTGFGTGTTIILIQTIK